jgi:tol-pal system protein YbgF
MPMQFLQRNLMLAGLVLAVPGTAFGYDMLPSPQTAVLARVAQADPAQLAVRVDQLETQIRDLTGQVEGLTFQVQQMQQLLSRLQGSEGGAPPAAPQQPAPQPQGEEAPPTVIPEQGVQPLPGELEFDPTFDDGTSPSGEIQLPASGDPLLDPSGPRQPALGELPVDLSMLEARPISLNYTPDARNGEDADADAQFAAAYAAMSEGDYEFAEDQFAQFLALYPEHRQAQDAANWLGEAMLARGAYQDAAEVLLDGYASAPDSPRAPDLMLRLGIALARADERDTACRTFSEIPNRFANLTPAFSERLELERAGAQCPPA